MENVYLLNNQAIKAYKIAHGITDWLAHLKINLEKTTETLKGLGFRCAVCSSGHVDAESFKTDDYSPLTRCKQCMKGRA